ncbi:nucleoside/nucleotide kinase family protein [Arthrobacter humicola]|uniref:nucleoside/nucleotide kinase family protein n=1 Tax=Arthrobacter humicola TaxID=409291 RepID=UPI001FAC2FDB|nr:nucleoside/nucleotide kinase family protein [Arthrobacter humicola]MCI9870394.1 nucleoside/nucleotide kinase family protein [Arthrobacter humicola]
MSTPPYLRWDESGQQQLLARAEALLQRRRRCLLGIAGAPGAGKSTISEWLLEHLDHPRQVALVPMDGYHLAQSLLVDRGLEHRKGAPETFDGAGYVALLRRLRSEISREIFAPVFRREVNDAIAGAIAVPPETRLIITEGNYLLLDEAPWNEVASLLDETWFVELEQGERLRRLTARHLRFDNDAAIAEWRATGNDERNARLVTPGSQRSTLVIEHTPATVSAPGRE